MLVFQYRNTSSILFSILAEFWLRHLLKWQNKLKVLMYKVKRLEYSSTSRLRTKRTYDIKYLVEEGRDEFKEKQSEEKETENKIRVLTEVV